MPTHLRRTQPTPSRSVLMKRWEFVFEAMSRDTRYRDADMRSVLKARTIHTARGDSHVHCLVCGSRNSGLFLGTKILSPEMIGLMKKDYTRSGNSTGLRLRNQGCSFINITPSRESQSPIRVRQPRTKRETDENISHRGKSMLLHCPRYPFPRLMIRLY